MENNEQTPTAPQNLKSMKELLEILKKSAIKPNNDFQKGFNFAIDCIISQIEIKLGHSKEYTIEELKNHLNNS
jgi:hypothetical protein